MADTQDLKVSERLLQLREAINKLNSQDDELTEKQQETLMKQEASLAKILRYQQKRVKDAVGTKQAELDLQKSYSEQLSSISSISSIYDGLKSTQSQSLTAVQQTLSAVQQSLLVDEEKRDVLTSTLEGINTLQDLQQKLAETGPDQLEAQKSIAASYDAQTNSLNEQVKSAKAFGIITEEQETALLAALDTQKESLKQAQHYGTISAENKETIQAQIDVYKGIDKSIRGVINTAKLLTTNLKAGIGIATAGLGVFANKFGDVNKELGQSFTQGLNTSTASASALSFVFDDTAGTVKSLASEFGGVEAATLSAQANVGLIAANMGISNTEAVGLMGSFARLNGGSADMAADMIKTTQEFANQNGIIPSDLMADLADSAEEFALYGKDGGKNILQAAGYAKKLGVNMSAISGVADNLLDFESSITKELELGAMLGRDINLDRARALAYAGDLEEATKETLNALGGQAAFNEMDYFQKKASADLLGVSVAELDKMVANQGKADTLGDSINKKFSLMGETLNMGLNNYLGTSLQGIGGMLVSAGQMSPVLKDMGINMGGMVKNTAQVLKNLLGMVAGPVLNGLKTAGSALADTKLGKGIGGIKDKLMAGVGDKAKSITTPSAGGAPSADKAGAFGKMNTTALLKGAAALLILGAALWVFAKAANAFGDDINWTNVFIGIGAMTLLGGVAALLGLAGPMILIGAGALLLASAAFYVFGIASQEVAKGMDMLGKVLPVFSAGMTAFAAAPYIQFAFGLGTLAAAMLVLGASAPFMILAGLGLQIVGAGLSSVITSMSAIGSVMGDMFQYIAPIAALSLALVGLAGALTLVGIAGIAALPGLMAVSAVGAIATGVGSMLGMGGEEGGGKDETTQALLDEMKGIRADLNAGKIAVHMDGTKVTSAVSKVVSKVGSNSYAV